MKRWIVPALLAGLYSLTSLAGEPAVIVEFEGRDNSLTEPFTVEGPWVMIWRLGSDFPGAVGFELNLVDARTRESQGLLVRTKRRGNGLKLFPEGGRYQIRVSASLAQWHLRIEQVSEEEAARLLAQ